MIVGTLESGEPLNVDLEKLIGSHLCIQANSGAGKSGAIRKVLELTHGRVQHIIIDTEDEFYTLREKFEYLIAGGDNGDCKATVANAAALATTILETGFSAIVQINSLNMGDREAFIRDFLTTLTNAPKRLWRPILVVLDEAQFYAPQKGYAGSLDAIVSFMMLGRKRGFTGVLATPRPADLSKQATSPVNNWMIGRCGQPVDRRAAADALGFAAKSPEARNLQSLVARQFWAFGPALINAPALAKIGKTETTIVKAGQATLPTPPAPAAMRKILASLNAAAAEAEKPTEAPLPNADPKPIAEIGSVGPDPQAIAEAEQRGFERGELAGLLRGSEEGAKNAKAFIAQVRETVARAQTQAETYVRAIFSEALAQIGIQEAAVAADAADRKFIEVEIEPVKSDAPKPVASTPPADGEITSAMRETLHALAWWARLGHRAPSKKQIGALLSIVPGGSTMRSRLAAVSKLGLIEYPTDETVALTAAGVKAAPAVALGAGLVATIRESLTDTQRETFDLIPLRGIARAELGKTLSIEPNGSTLRSRLAELSNRELIEYADKGQTIRRQAWVRA